MGELYVRCPHATASAGSGGSIRVYEEYPDQSVPHPKGKSRFLPIWVRPGLKWSWWKCTPMVMCVRMNLVRMYLVLMWEEKLTLTSILSSFVG